MKALAIDSSAPCLCVAAQNGADTVSCIYDIGMRQSETILGAVDYVIDKARIKKGELDFAVLCAGPGSFTSLRLSFAALKAINLAWNTPVYAVPTLEAIARPYLDMAASCSKASYCNTFLIPVLDARKDRFYAAVYRAAPAYPDVPPAIALPAGDYTANEIINALLGNVEDKTIPLAVNASTADTPKVDAPIMGTVLASIPEGNIPVLKSSARYVCQIFAAGGGAQLFKEKATGICNVSIAVLPSIPVTSALFDIAARYIKEGASPLQDFDGPLYLRPCDATAHLTKNNS